jgi:predicted dehydrogenase
VRALLDDRWQDGLLDYHRSPGEYRVEVQAWLVLEPVQGMYFVRPFSPRMVGAYVREVGLRETARKVASRLRERGRNEKYVASGAGRVLEAPEGGRFAAGERVAFVAPSHPGCVDRIVLPEALLGAPVPVPEREGWLLHRRAGRSRGHFAAVAGWSPHSGIPLDAAAVDEARAALDEVDWAGATWLRAEPHADVAERAEPRRRRRRRRRERAALFGYGNYAKTTVLPGVRRSLDVETLHEIDPTQIPAGPPRGRGWDTAPWPRDDEVPGVWFLAGYHHTHAPLAVTALERGAAAVVEKPVATTEGQLQALLRAMRETGRPLYACFQRRYLPFNALAMRDLGAAPGDPISYHCIVYEVPLPPLHWYRWPASRSRLVSNGCHWIDHFLHLNGYAEVTGCRLAVAPDGSLDVAMELSNGAPFTMVLTDRGSPRVGVQDHVELRTADATVRIVNSTRYFAQRASGAVRRRRIAKAAAYRRMYRSIARDIARGGAGDSSRSVEVSTGAVLRLEAELEALGSSWR